MYTSLNSRLDGGGLSASFFRYFKTGKSGWLARRDRRESNSVHCAPDQALYSLNP
jgi:hypothetical protein